MPPREYHFWVYILSNRSHTLYIGLTNNLRARVEQHRQLSPGTHTGRYQIGRLVYYDFYKYIRDAIAREKELKRWNRAQKSPSSRPSIRRGKSCWSIKARRTGFAAALAFTFAAAFLVVIPYEICV